MNNPFNSPKPRILPKVGYAKTSFNIVSPLIKLDIIKEGEGRKCRNASKLDLSNSIYEKIENE